MAKSIHHSKKTAYSHSHAHTHSLPRIGNVRLHLDIDAEKTA